MSIVNEDILRKILTLHDNEPATELTNLMWNVNNNIIRSGNNYMSEASRITVEYQKNGVNYKKSIFLKVPFNSPAYETGTKFQLFQRELIMYTEILPHMYAIDEEHFFPRYYHGDEKLSLFLKDLSQSGYKVGNRNDQLDFQQCYHAFKCLAKFHGLSVKVERTRGIPDMVRKDAFFHDGNKDLESRNTFLSGIAKFYDNLDWDIQKKYFQQIELFKGTTWEHLVEDLNPDGNSFNVLTHGDFWTNNIMFKYDTYGIVRKTKLIDFQQCRWGSPTLDLLYFTVTSMRFEVFAEYFDLLLAVYLDDLNKILKSLNCGVYTMEELKSDIEKRYRYCLLLIASSLAFVVSDPEDPIDMSEAVKNDRFDVNCMCKTYEQKGYIDIATKWFVHFAEKAVSDIFE